MPRRILQGEVISNKADKTIIVKVERKITHPTYGKIIRRAKKYAAHDPENRYKTGEKVRIIETRPISKTKTWIVMEQENKAESR